MSFIIFLIVAMVLLAMIDLFQLFQTPEQKEKRNAQELYAAMRMGQIAKRRGAYWKGHDKKYGEGHRVF